MIPCMQETSQTLIAGPLDQQKISGHQVIPCMQETSQTLIAGPEDQQKFADLEMKPQLSG